MTTIYATNSLPQAWVVRDGGKYWIVPAIEMGWEKRREFRGNIKALLRVSDYNKTGLGIPKHQQTN